MQYSLGTLINEWLDDSSWKTKQGLLKKYLKNIQKFSKYIKIYLKYIYIYIYIYTHNIFALK